MKNFYWLLPCILLSSQTCFSQGCIPIRNLVGFGQFVLPSSDSANKAPVRWLVNVNGRYLNSYKTYDEDREIASGSENNVYETNFSLTRIYDKGFSFSADVPFISASRSTNFEHDGSDPAKTRYTTKAVGLGDIRLTGYKWLFDVSKPHRGNIQLGLGIKLATGDYKSEDFFHKDYKNPTALTSAPVNASIQPGDGGTGLIVELNSFYALSKAISLYGNFFYLFNPKDQNGVSTANGGLITDPNIIKAGGTVYSVPDAYTMRAGANVAVSNFTFWFGVRREGTPVYDLIGESNGVRRAGTYMSIEPGINYRFKNTIVYTFAPIPFYRYADQTVPDRIRSELTGTRFASPGGYANYLIFIGAIFKINEPVKQSIF